VLLQNGPIAAGAEPYVEISGKSQEIGLLLPEHGIFYMGFEHIGHVEKRREHADQKNDQKPLVEGKGEYFFH
jgi:hypothetical protein